MEENKGFEQAEGILCTYTVFYILKKLRQVACMWYFTQGLLTVAYK